MKIAIPLIAILALTSLTLAAEKPTTPVSATYTFNCDKPFGKITTALTLTEKSEKVAKQFISAITLNLEDGRKIEVPAQEIGDLSNLPASISANIETGFCGAHWLNLELVYTSKIIPTVTSNPKNPLVEIETETIIFHFTPDSFSCRTSSKTLGK